MSGRGRFITFEGGEGGGKTTQTRLLLDVLGRRGIQAIATREPGGAPGAEEIRNLLVTGETGRWDPMTEAVLHFAARQEHVARTIRPALAAGTWVVCDRFIDSTMAYQGYAQRLGRDKVEGLARAILGDLKPDLTIVLDLPVESGLARERAKDRYARMGEDFHRTVREAFLDIARREPTRCVVIDATQTIEAVSGAIAKAVEQRLL